MANVVIGSEFVVSGDGSCVGGKHPDPPLDEFPLLAWSPAHEAHGAKVFTEDGAVSVEDAALAFVEQASLGAVAARFGTTEDHVVQAVNYAGRAGFISYKS